MKPLIKQFPFYRVNTFTSEKLKGNPTAVCLVDDTVSKQLMQETATELNLPVTAFVCLANDISAIHNLYYFTPLTEIPACGHATLAAAKTVSLVKNAEQLDFITIENKIIHTSVSNGKIAMLYPDYGIVPYKENLQLIQSLSLTNYSFIGFCKELDTLFIEIPGPSLLRKIKPDYEQLKNSTADIKEVVITSTSDDDRYDYLLRSFCPWIGIDEDPVTGSVHSVLAGYWSGRLNKQQLKAYQASERGGELFLTHFEDKVKLEGEALLIMEGSLYI